MRKGRTNRPRPIEEKVACPDLTGGARRMRRKGRPLQRGRGGAIRGCSDCRQREVIEQQDRWFRGLAEFFASQGEISVKSVFLRGRVPRKTHFSACQCASVSRKRVRAAGCNPLCRQSPLALSTDCASPRCLRQRRGCFFALREAGFPAGLPFVFPCRIFGKFIRQMGD